MNEDSIFSEQSRLLHVVAEILDTRIIEIEEKEKEKEKTVSISESEKSSIIAIFVIRSLKYYKDSVIFLAGEIDSPDLNRHIFATAHVRTLLDIYGRFLHLLENCRNEDERALTCISYQLLTYNKVKLFAYYRPIINLYENFLKSINFTFPTEARDLNYDWIKEKKLNFVSYKKLLKTEKMKKYATYTLDIFSLSDFANLYSSFSEYVHGNPFLYQDSPRNERFWIASMSILISSFLIELNDLYFLNKTNPRDFNRWQRDIKKSKRYFLPLWLSRRT